MAVGLQLVDLDRVVLALADALAVGVVPEDGDGAAGVQGQLGVTLDLDQLLGLERLQQVGGQLQGERLAPCPLRVRFSASLMVESVPLSMESRKRFFP